MTTARHLHVMVGHRSTEHCTFPTQSNGTHPITMLSLFSPQVAPFGFYRIQRYLKDEMGATESQLLAWRMHWLHLGFKGINEMLETVPSGSPAAVSLLPVQ